MKLFILLSILVSHFVFAEGAVQCPAINPSEENLKASVGLFTRAEISREIHKLVSPEDKIIELSGAPSLLFDKMGCRRIVNTMQFFAKGSDGCDAIYTVVIWDQLVDQYKDSAEVRKRSLNCNSQEWGKIHSFVRK
jgi:hypothetical protein